MVKRLCISVSDDEAQFLEIMQLSPSGLIKQRILQIKEDSSNYQNMIKAKETAIMEMHQLIKEKEQEITELNKKLKDNGII